MQHPLLSDSFNYNEETYADAMERYSGFGAKLFEVLKSRIPEVLQKLRFFQSISYQQEDVYAVYENGSTSFVIQLEPVGEVICIWNDTVSTEIGSWSENEYEEAVQFIITDLLNKGTK